MKRIIIINGPNINLIGSREPKIYGNININRYLDKLKRKYFKKKILIKIFNTISESKIIKYLHYSIQYNKSLLGIIINAGAYTHTSLAISDTIKYISSLKINIIELHVSNIFAREGIRHNSLISSSCSGIIIGFGIVGYNIGIFSLINKNLIN
ncbi:MAG: 3-dehydroquinate dehydratase [Candidatus Shikimatogenerans bostrichidophilus]|nr:MAG: 3-dehydroquinate dehydratase [Candidatus Shikimatogenerans bostrichidophilus]